jgi:hypothetical protein
VLGCPVPSPYFLQELLLGPSGDPDNEESGSSFLNIFLSLDLSARDLAFYENATSGLVEWWDSSPEEETPLPTVNELYALLDDHLKWVSPQLFISDV